MEFLLSLSDTYKILIGILLTILLFRLCYFFKGFSKFTFPSLVGIFIALFFMVVLLFVALVETHYVMRLKENYALSEGKITYYHTGRGKSKGQVEYDYKINGELTSDVLYENSFVEIPDTRPDTTIHYLVIYEKTLPQNSFLLFNYPIRDKDDILLYEKLFKNGIPHDVF